MNTKIKYLILLVILAMLAAPLVGALAASGTPEVYTGYHPFAVFKAGVKFQSFNAAQGSYEAILGSYGFPQGSPTIDFNGGADCANVTRSGTWNRTPTTNHITFSYDPATGILRTTIQAKYYYCKEIYVGDLGVLNYIRIDLANLANGTSVAFNAMKVDGIDIQNFTGVPGATKTWSVRELTFTDGFTIEGDILLSKQQAGQDTNKIEITVGHYDVLGPISSNLSVLPEPVYLNGPGTVSATVDDSTTYGSNIASADFILDSDLPIPMDASDVAFDEVTEEVNAGFIGSPVGTHTACVYGTDDFWVPNVGDPLCLDFIVDYVFYGFDEPVDNDLLNIAKAGQAIPIKWRLTDALGVPIDDPASFIGLFTDPVSCDEITNPDGIEEYAAGDSGLQYLGDGYWQINWKTPKLYSGTCRALYVKFNSGTTSPVVEFLFK